MARYIDTDILAKIVFDKWKECDELKQIIPAIRDAVMCASTADVVEVVRCKDCKYREGSACDYSAVYVRPNGYCQWGEKEEEPTMEEYMYGQEGSEEDGSL